MRQLLLVLIISLLSLAIVNAQELNVTHRIVKDNVFLNEDAQVILSIENKEKANNFKIEAIDDYWRLKAEPKYLDIGNKETKESRLYITPLSTARPGSYLFSVNILSSKNDELIDKYSIKLVLIDPGNAINVELLSTIVDPRKEESLLQIRFENNYNTNLDNVKVKIESSLFNFERILSFKPYEEKIEDFIVDINPDTQQKEYPVIIDLYYKDNLLSEYEKSINVAFYSDLKKSENFRSSIFSKTKEITIVNDGNALIRGRHEEETSWIKKVFTRTDPRPEIIEREGKKYMVWNFDVGPKSSYTINITTSYRGFSWFVILLIVLIGLWYYFFAKEVSISKRVSMIRGHTGSLGQFKVLLVIKNKGNRVIDGLKIRDALPNIIHPVREEFGHMHPSSIKKTGLSTVLLWDVPRLGPGGEIVLSYKVEAKLHLVGRLILPAANVLYKNKNNRIVKVSSGRLNLFSLS